MSKDSSGAPSALEMLSVILLAIATVGSAWCAYQSTRWNGEEAMLSQRSTDARVEATRLFSYATQVTTYDSGIAADYAQAYLDGDEELQAFYRNVLARPAFVETLDEWVATVDAGDEAIGSLLTDEEYLADQLDGYDQAMAESDDSGAKARTAGKNADDYIVLTLLLAGALFFAGVMSTFRSRIIQLMLLTMSALLIAVTAGQMAGLPIV